MPERQTWLHGTLELALLALLAEQHDYGVGLAARLEHVGVGSVPGGTLYPSLLRLERQGLVAYEHVASRHGPRRKYYRLTDDGQAALAKRAAEWAAFTDAMSFTLAYAETNKQAATERQAP